MLSTKPAAAQSYISKAEQGERRIDVIEFLLIASAIGFDPCKFMKKLRADR
jgi:hypothetical protein